ncbi:MAG: hypothetical protein FJX56_04020, partial [Alphaproteobacteria bacterium]|nr:hypothetical protein [Alphaproteobacteria bacterium]
MRANPPQRKSRLAAPESVVPRPSVGCRSCLLALLVALAIVVAFRGEAAAEQVPESAEQIRLSFAPVVARAAPAVVNIYARKLVRSR